MLVRELKLKPTKAQETELNQWLWNLTGVYNWASRKIEQDASSCIHHSKFDLFNLVAFHSRKLKVPAHTIQGVVQQSWNAWDRCFKKLGGQPKLKSIRNKLKSIPFPDAIPLTRVKKNRIKMPVIGSLKYFKQDLPLGNIKQARIIKRASGWYCQLTIDINHTFKVKNTDKKVGIDTGFKYLAVLSDGTKIENQRNYLKSQEKLAQVQRGRNKKKVARLHERIKNQRKDYNHKVSRKIVENYSEIYCTNDNLKGQQKKFGKSVSDAGISQLRQMLTYKSDNHGRRCVLVDSKYTTMTCSNCGARTGPIGLAGLKVRFWECGCGAVHDRDVNAARVVLKTGPGCGLVFNKGEI